MMEADENDLPTALPSVVCAFLRERSTGIVASLRPSITRRLSDGVVALLNSPISQLLRAWGRTPVQSVVWDVRHFSVVELTTLRPAGFLRARWLTEDAEPFRQLFPLRPPKIVDDDDIVTPRAAHILNFAIAAADAVCVFEIISEDGKYEHDFRPMPMTTGAG